MPKKTVILCEGVHDLIFFSILLDQKGISYRSVYNRELTETRERTPETNTIRRFISRKGGNTKFLIKDEDGWKNCIDNFVTLYEDMNPKYRLLLCLDDDQKTRERLKRATNERFRKDILLQQSEFLYQTKDEMKHLVFFIPGSLERQLRQITGKNPDLKGDEGRSTLTSFIDQCRREDAPWLSALETILSD
ncbi:hypothetical protein J2T58_001689 [Methanocalculus alkaliphilus]|uniref:hypothetical protein n=1 Tax=Methanocalculus alkaliphilus TaxID=768730 RepID=UPI00209F92E3|nr:hypothetical protein [Methanocalculus alkaliphilus]MCP1715818.1 hypothetical protein [Methanocalculus alkaliphilus]